MNNKNYLANHPINCAIKENESYRRQSGTGRLIGRLIRLEDWFRLKAFCKRQARFSRFTLSLLGLGFCVFMWGLQYKLSLYDPPQAASHEIPTAKLLSKNEQPAASEPPLIRKTSVSDGKTLRVLLSLTFPLLAALNLLYRPLLAYRDSGAKRPWQIRLQASLNAFSFRPPPILV